MTEPAFESPPIGHNIPPGGVELSALRDRTAELIETTNRWINERPELLNEDMAAKARDFYGQLDKQIKAVDKERSEQKRPHLDANLEIDARFNPLKRLLETAKELFKNPIEAWGEKLETQRLADLRAAEEDARKAQETAQKATDEAARGGGDVVGKFVAADEAVKKADEAAKEAEQIAKSKISIKGNYSDRAMGFRATWKARVKNIDVAFQSYRDHPEVAALLTRLASADARGGRRRINGFEIYSNKSM